MPYVREAGSLIAENDVILYKCVVCARAFTKVQSLRAHLKVHQDIKWTNFTVKLPRWKVNRFNEICKKHNTTSCHLISTLMDAVDSGDKSGLVQIGAPNPLVINVMSFFAGRPRGRNKYNFALAADQLTQIVFCKQLIHKAWNKRKLGWCRRNGRWVTVQICQACVDPDYSVV